MSRWTHRICRGCWTEHLQPTHGEPVTIAPRMCPEVEPCCWCGAELTRNDFVRGIYVRKDPDNLACKGDHR